MKRDVTLDVSNSKDLSKEIGRIIGNKFEYAMNNKRKINGLGMYPGLTLQIDEDKLSIDEIKEKIPYLENAVIGSSDKILPYLINNFHFLRITIFHTVFKFPFLPILKQIIFYKIQYLIFYFLS